MFKTSNKYLMHAADTDICQNLWPEDRLYILPMDDGDTIIVHKENNQPNFLRWSIQSELDYTAPDEYERKLKDLYNSFTSECKLKITLFMEMSRSLPTWTEIKYDWLQELLQMTVRGHKLDPNRELTVTEEVILKWLLFTITDPKIIKLPKSVQDTLLEMTSSSGPEPTDVFLLEYSDMPFPGEISYGFLVPKPADIFTLLFLFPEAGKGWCFTKSLEEAYMCASDQTIQLSGETDTRYKIVLLMEYLNNPGIDPVENTCPDEILPQCQKVPISRGFFRIVDTKNARILGVFLYKIRYSTLQRRGPVRSGWILFALASLCIVYNTVSKLL